MLAVVSVVAWSVYCLMFDFLSQEPVQSGRRQADPF